MNPLIRLILAGVIVHAAGCAWQQQIRYNGMPLSESCREMALAGEKRGDLEKALFHWDVIHRLNPEDKEALSQVARLKKIIEDRADMHFQKGKQALLKGSADTAKREFRIALLYSPRHREAIRHLKGPVKTISIKVKRHDTFRGIAREVYKDADKGFLVAYFADKDGSETPEPGSVIDLPLPGSPLAVWPRDTVRASAAKARLTEAKALLEKSEFERAMAVADEILKRDPGDRNAALIRNSAAFHLGQSSFAGGDYVKALKMFEQVDPGYENLTESIALVRGRMQSEAESHYRAGVRYFLEEDLEQAISEWERTLELNPDHQQAGSDLEKAKMLLKRLNQME